MKKIWQKISRIGFDLSLPESEQKKIIFSNQVRFFALIINCGFTAFYALKGMYAVAAVMGFAGLAIAFSYWLNYKKRYDLARLNSSYFGFLLFAIGLLMCGRGWGFEYGFYLMLALPLFYLSNNVRHAIIYYSIVFASIAVTLGYSFFHEGLATSYVPPKYVEYITFLTTSFWLILMLITNIKVNREYEEKNRALMEQLKIKNEELTNFAYVTSHDLKEPLRMINGFTKLLQKKLKGSSDESTEEYMTYITDGAKRMDDMLSDLLKYATVGNEANYELMELNEILESVKINLQARIKDCKGRIEYDTLPNIKVPKTLMMQLMQNLISNALKFKRPNVNPIVQIYTKQSRDMLRLEFKDNGIGISKENQEKVFDIFKRINSRTEYEGSGIGLATCMKIVQKLEGKIWLTSEPGVGTSFFVEIPVQERTTEVTINNYALSA